MMQTHLPDLKLLVSKYYIFFILLSKVIPVQKHCVLSWTPGIFGQYIGIALLMISIVRQFMGIALLKISIVVKYIGIEMLLICIVVQCIGIA